jgi:hypothetical protein
MKREMSKPTEQEKAYRVMRRGDGVWCIYVPSFAVVVAEFSRGTSADAEIIGKQLTAIPKLIEALRFYANLEEDGGYRAAKVLKELSK